MDLNPGIVMPALTIAIVITYYLIGRKKPKSNKSTLYYSLLHDGCQYCGGNFSVTSSGPPGEYMDIECDDCDKQYRLDPGRHWASEL